jgi:hypothetical protein
MELDDVIFQFRFTTQILQPHLPVGYIGGIAGIPADHVTKRRRF